MDDYTGLVLAVQLTALGCIAASILLYLGLAARRAASGREAPGLGRSVLLTSADTAAGLQLCLHLASRGFRVFAGVKQDPQTDPAAAMLRSRLKELEAARPPDLGTLVLVKLDVTREDSLHEAVDAVRRHLPAGENGLWAVVNLSGVAVKGRLEAQESSAWEAMFKVNVVGALRTARAFLPLLKPTKGRLVTLGLSSECRGKGAGAVAYAASRHAVAGASEALAAELAPLGVSVLTLHTSNLTADTLYNRAPTRGVCGPLPEYALDTIEEAVVAGRPLPSYEMRPPSHLTASLNACASRLSPRPPAHKPLLTHAV